jgi:hypothetical protein
MPLMDGTGPLGEGPGSGRGRGTCAGARRGMRWGLGRGRGAAGTQDQKTALAQQAGFLERQLDRIKRQLSGPGGAPPSK